MLFITGATGSIGSELCRLLGAENVPSRAMYRKEGQQTHFEKLGIEAVRADFDDADSMRQAMQGCDTLFLLTAPDPQHAQREMAIIKLAIERGYAAHRQIVNRQHQSKFTFSLRPVSCPN